ncbi:MAG: alcohol dehydrogenase catalytic domain-containing protein [Bryobacteraceae bacterium]|nr:alcohol dehydrogenase catalytic domain-containing protein [Bryobacteraceae bacterium]
MIVAELFEPRRFRLFESERVPPGPGEIQVRVRHVGICGSDLHYYAEGSIGDVVIRYPVVLGHEPTGEITGGGTGVTGITTGARVLLEPALFCYHCEQCHSGRHNLCDNIRFLSSPPEPGFFREYVNLPAHNVLPMPDSLDSETATLFEPLAVVLHSLQFAHIQLGETLAVFGAGPIGLLTLAALRMTGAGRIWVIEPRAERRELAMQLGASAVIDPAGTDAVRDILRETGKRGVDCAIDCATKAGTIQAACAVTRSAGRTIVTGIPSEPQTEVNFHVLRRKELTIYNIRRSNHETPAAIAMLEANPKLFRTLITHRMDLAQANAAFDMLETGSGGAAKIVISI